MMFALLLGCAAPPRFLEEHRICTIPSGAVARGFKFSRDGRIAAFILHESGKDRVVIGDRRGTPLDQV